MTDSDKIREAEALLTQGDTLRSQGRDAEAEPLYLRAVGIFENAGATDVQIADAYLRLADLSRFLDLNPEAVPLYRRALTLLEKSLGTVHPRVADVLLRLGDAYAEEDWTSPVAGLHYERALGIIEKTLTDGRTLADARPDLLAVHYEREGRYVDSESLYRWTLAILTEELGQNHLRVADHTLRLGRFCWGRGRFEESTGLLRQALDIAEKVLGPEHPGLRPYLRELAGHCPIFDFREVWGFGVSSGPPTPRMDVAREVETLCLRALAIAEKSFGKDHPAVVRDLIALESLYRELKRDDEAKTIRRRILAIIDRVGPDKRLWAVDTLLRLRTPSPGDLSADADALLHQARVFAERGFGADEGAQTDTLFRLAQLCLNEGRPSDAEELFARARAMAECAFGTAHPRVACVLLRTGLAYYGKENAKAQRYYDEAFDMLKGSSSIDDPCIADELLSYALIYQTIPGMADAFERFGAAVNAGQLTPVIADPPPSPDVEPFLQTLGFSPFKVDPRPYFGSLDLSSRCCLRPSRSILPPAPMWSLCSMYFW